MSGKLELRALIARHGFRETKFAKHINMNQATLSLILNDKVEPKESQIERICIALGIEDPREYLFSDKFRKLKQKGA